MQLKVDVDIVRSLTTRVRPGRPGMISGLAGSARSFFCTFWLRVLRTRWCAWFLSRSRLMIFTGNCVVFSRNNFV